MSDVKLRNPQLYRALCRTFGQDHVEVRRPGESLQGRYRRSPIRTRSGEMASRLKFDRDASGEEFIINCPFCNDTRHRLSINHCWAETSPEGDERLWMAQCYNEHCLQERANQQALYDRVYALSNSRKVRTGPIEPEEITVRTQPRAPVVPPGSIVRLDDLAQTMPSHPALLYLSDRGFDPGKLGRFYGVGWCQRADEGFGLASRRLYFPIVMHGKLVGWQCRAPRDWKRGDPPKYYSSPDMQRSKLVFGLDWASRYRTVVVVEGILDAIAFGPPAVACVGKTLSPEMVTLLVSLFGEGSLAILLDPEQDEVSKKKNRLHHIEKMYEQCRGRFDQGVARIYLPKGKDPGSLSRSFLRAFARQEANKQGVPLHLKAVR